VLLAETVRTVSNTVVNRQTYRELVTATAVGESPWAQPMIAIAPIDTARQNDIAESLAQEHWDRVIIDEAHLLSGPHRMTLLERLISANAVGRLLLMTATPLPYLSPLIEQREEYHTGLLPGLAITNWLAELRDWQGNVISRVPVEWNTVEYRRGPDEVAFLKMLQEGLQQAASNWSSELVQSILLRRAASCVFAVEQSLRHLHRGLASHKILTESDEPVTQDADEPEDTIDEDVSEAVPHLVCEDEDKARQFLEACLESVDRVQSDEKLIALTGVLQQLVARPSTKICVLSSFMDTVDYLQAAVRDLGIVAEVVTGGQPLEERQEAVNRFLGEGKLLFATDAVMEGLGLEQVNHVIHFDLPQNPTRLMQRQGRFDRIGRTELLTMYYLRDTSKVLPFDQLIERLFAKVEEVRKAASLPD
jgi:SNF2 family DNA or RNA helicase